MKKLRLTVVLITILLVAEANLFGQKGVESTGDVSVIRDEKILGLEFRYDRLKIGELSSEQEYIDKRVAEYEAKKAGKGAEWMAEWKEIKSGMENSFLVNLNKALKKKGVVVEQGASSVGYTLVVHSIFLEIGWSAGIISGTSELDIEVWICKKDRLNEPIAKILVENSAADYETNRKRLELTYMVAARRLGKFFEKNLYSVK